MGNPKLEMTEYPSRSMVLEGIHMQVVKMMMMTTTTTMMVVVI